MTKKRKNLLKNYFTESVLSHSGTCSQKTPFTYSGCQRFFLHGFRCRSCRSRGSSAVLAEFGRRLHAKYFRPPRARKNLWYPEYLLPRPAERLGAKRTKILSQNNNNIIVIHQVFLLSLARNWSKRVTFRWTLSEKSTPSTFLAPNGIYCLSNSR